MYFAVYICGDRSPSTGDTVLSGYVSSSHPQTSRLFSPANCTAAVKNLPPHTAVKFEVTDYTFATDSAYTYKLTIGDNPQSVEKGDIVVRLADSSGTIEVKSALENGNSVVDDAIRLFSKYTGKRFFYEGYLCMGCSFVV